jgi:hypothetical protein
VLSEGGNTGKPVEKSKDKNWFRPVGRSLISISLCISFWRRRRCRHHWLSNLRVLEVTEIKTVPYVLLSRTFVERLKGPYAENAWTARYSTPITHWQISVARLTRFPTLL